MAAVTRTLSLRINPLWWGALMLACKLKWYRAAMWLAAHPWISVQ